MSEVTSESSTIDATARIGELEGKLAAAEKSLSEAREALDAAERKTSIDRELVRQGAIDVETAALLTETAVASMEKPDVKAAIGDLRRGKPFLFRTAPRASAMSGTPSEVSPLDDAAAAARESGDRRALLRYLRMRRGG
jgi:hypothetical protein